MTPPGDPGAVLAYFWYDSDGAFVSGGLDPNVTTALSGDETYDLVVINTTTGCADTTTISVIDPLCGTISGSVTEDLDNNDTGDEALSGVQIKVIRFEWIASE